MLVLTGTSGGLGSVVLKTILAQDLLPAHSLRISAYSSSSVPPEALAAGVEIRHGDLRKPETLADSYAGADALFLVSYPSVGEERFELHKTAIDAAKRAGVKHVIYTSLTFGGREGEESVAGVMQAHLRTTRYLKASGLSWTIVREATYAHLWNNHGGFLQLGSESDLDAVLPETGPASWVSREDLGEGTAKIVVRWESYANQTINLTGATLLTVPQILDSYAKHTGHCINLRIVSAEEAVAYHREHKSVPPEQESFLPNWASWHTAMKNGELNYTDPTLERLLGRRPRGIEEMMAELFDKDKQGLDTKDFV